MSDRTAAQVPFDPPLAGVCVVDWTMGWPGDIARYLVELGADVVRVDASNPQQGPTIAGVSVVAALQDRGKRLATGEPLTELLSNVDILIVSPGAGAPSTEAICAEFPTLVVLHASDFGMVGPYAKWQASGPVLHALSGELSRSGKPGRVPLLPPGNLAYACAISQAVFVLIVAYLERLRTGQGDLLDFAALDGAVQALDPGYGIGGSATLGVPACKLPRGRPAVGYQYPILPCADGEVRIAVLAPRQWQGLFEWMGSPEAFADPSFLKTGVRFASPTLLPAIAAFFANKTRNDLEEEGARRGVPIAGLLTLAEALESEQVKARRAFADVELAPGIIAPAPAGLMEIDGSRVIAGGPATAPSPSPVPLPHAGTRPLEGLRVLDLGVIVVGAESGRLLGDQGADVIKVEASAFPDGSRGIGNAQGMSVTVAAGHRNKRSLGINLRDEAGKALFRRLAAKSDVILSNFKAGTMESLGLGYETLAADNPGLIMVDSSAYGATGPWSRRLGYGPLVRASAGLTALWRYDDDPTSYSDAITVYPDHVAGRIGTIGVLALLIRRARTGRGGTISISQAEVMLAHMATDIAVAALRAAGAAVEEPLLDAPSGVFPCAGDDDWCVVTVRGDADWQALCSVIDRADLAADVALASVAGRHAARDRIDAAMTAWLADRTPIKAMDALQASGVPAGAMLRVSELPDFSYYRDRGLFRTEAHPYLPEQLVAENAPIRSMRLPDPPARPAPVMGEHTVEIAREWLGLDEDEIADLIARGVLEMPKLRGDGR